MDVQLKRGVLEICVLSAMLSEETYGRLRKYYSITADGKKKIREFLTDWADIVKIYEFIKGEYNE